MEAKRPVGKPRIDSIIPLETIVNVFLESNSQVEAAKKLGISTRTLRRELVLARVERKKPRCRSQVKESTPLPWNVDFKTPIHSWIKEHPENIEHSPTKLAKLVGCPEKQVRNYFYRKRIALELFLQSLGNLGDCGKKLVDVRGRTFLSRFIADYKLHIDPITYQVTIKGFIASVGSFTAKLGFEDYCSLLNRRVDPRSFFQGVNK